MNAPVRLGLLILLAGVPWHASIAQQWTDVRTGTSVSGGPVIPFSAAERLEHGLDRSGWYRTVLPDPADASRAYDPQSGRNFRFDRARCNWIDVRTGERVSNGPAIPFSADERLKYRLTGSGWYRTVLPDPGDPKRTYDLSSGRNFVQTCKGAVPPRPACPPSPPPEPVRLGATEQRILDLHNAERAAVGAPALQWNGELAEHSKTYAEQVASTGNLTHASREGRGVERENLQQGLPGWGPDRLLQDWIGEKRDFMPGLFPMVSRSGDWSMIAHYSQIIWPTTTDLGCGIAQGRGYQWLVCRYSPGGNRDGQPVGIPVPPPPPPPECLPPPP